MPFGQSVFTGIFVGSLSKRISFLVAGACGMNRRDADLFSDEIAITASHTIGIAASVATFDPVGAGLVLTHTALLENDLKNKRSGKM